MTARKGYTVHIAMTARFWEHEEVEAESQEAAEELAGELFQCDWDCSESEVIATTVLTENG